MPLHNSRRQLILPGDLRFNQPIQERWLRKQQFHTEYVSLVVDADTGLYRPVSGKELEDYVKGGEYDEVMELGLATD